MLKAYSQMKPDGVYRVPMVHNAFLKALGIEIKSLFFPRSFTSMILERFSDCDDQLKDFFREKSKKVVIFVTDDNSRMLPEHFFDALSETPYSDIIFHTFEHRYY